jgi:predicted  nucleic acid-binding Zn-ribbon protein
MNADWTQWIYIIVIAAMVIWSFMRRRKSGNTKVDAAVAVLANVNDNLRVLQERMNNWQSRKKFQTKSWQMYQDKLDSLDPALMSALNTAFVLADEFNARIDIARRNNMMATLQDMQLEKLQGPLMKSKEGLIEWLKTAYQNDSSMNQRRGCLGM